MNVYKFAPLVITPWDRQSYTSRPQTFPRVFADQVRLSVCRGALRNSLCHRPRPSADRCPAAGIRDQVRPSGGELRTLRTRTTERQLFQQWTVPQQSTMRLVKSLTGDIAYFYVSNYPFVGGEEHLIDDAFFDRERCNSHRKFVWFVITSSKPINFFLLILYWFH